jgi:uncharacterized membrane protein YhaH (DUF805 family)
MDDLFSLKGRIGRRKYGLIQLSVITVIVSMTLIGHNIEILKENPSIIFNGMFAMTYIGLAYISIAGMVKRLHDMDKSGYYILLLFIPIINIVFKLGLFFVPGVKKEDSCQGNLLRI